MNELVEHPDMKVLSLVSYTFLPAQTGGQKGIALFNKYFSQKVELHCFTTKANQNQLAGYNTIPLFSGTKLRYINLFYFFKIRKYIRKNNITHVVIEHPYFGWLGILLKTFCGIKLITHSHNIESLRWRDLGKWWWKILFRYEKIVHRKSDYNFFITDEDRGFAIEHFHLSTEKCITVTYGTELKEIPFAKEVDEAKKFVWEKHQIKDDEIIMLFNGAFNYDPNLKALDQLVNRINPFFLANPNLKYKIIICGKYLPKEFSCEKTYPNIIFAGFVEDITLYLRSAKIFLNPVSEGGGIKTKLVEALAYNLSCISFATGALGIPKGITGDKFFVVRNDDFRVFAECVFQVCRSGRKLIPDSFFKTFYWGNIIDNCVSFLKDSSKKK